MFRLSDIERDFLASMASNNTRTYTCVKDVLRDVWDSDFQVDLGSEFGDLSSEEEEMIDAGCDPEVESAVARYVEGFFSLFCVQFIIIALSTQYFGFVQTVFVFFCVLRRRLCRIL